MFYVDTNGTIQGIISPLGGDASTPDIWRLGTIGSLKLQVSDSMFIRSCVPQSSNYIYGNNASLYLYFASPEGSIKKYGWWSSDSTGIGMWKQLDDMPPVNLMGAVECQLVLGIETLWIINSENSLEQWWRSYAAGTDWTRGTFCTLFRNSIKSSPKPRG